MDQRINIINMIKSAVTNAAEMLQNADDKKYSNKPAENKWSKKEILGHLCDSAVNNLSRFIRAQFEPEPFVVVPYEQDEWVKRNKYNSMNITEILNYWQVLNSQICHVIANIPEDKLAVECELGNAAFRDNKVTKNLLWLIEDYAVHMEYHLKQITGR